MWLSALFNGVREAESAGEGSHSPNGSTPSGVLSDGPVPHWFVRLLRWLGFNARSHLDGDVKQQMGGRRYTVLNDRFPLHSWVARQVIW